MRRLAFAAVVVVLVGGCVRPATRTARVKAPPIVRPNWAANETSHDHFNVVAASRQAAKEAEVELCPPSRYVCAIQPYEAFSIERKRK